MASKKEMMVMNGQSQKSDGQQLLEAAVFGIALGIAVGAIALYMSQKKEQQL